MDDPSHYSRARAMTMHVPIITIMILCAAIPAWADSAQPDDALVLSRDGLRVALSREWGGAIRGLWYQGRSYVDDNDSGRLVQSALFSRADTYWNPTQGGATGNVGGGVVELKQTGPHSAYSRSQALQWNPDGKLPERSPIVMEQWTTVTPDHVEVKYRITNTGPRVAGAINQEMPVVYMTPKPESGKGSFNHVHAYTGAHPWTGDADGLFHFDTTKHAEEPTYHKDGVNLHTTEYWMAYTDENGDGLTLFDPGYNVGHARRSYGIAPKFKMLRPFEVWGADDPLGRNVFENTVYLFPGDWRQARVKIAAMDANRTEWSFAQDGAAWAVEGAVVHSDEMFTLEGDGKPFAIESSPVDVHADSFGAMEVTYEATGGITAMALQFKHDFDREWRTVDSSFTVTTDGQEHTARVGLSTHPWWIGQIRALRLEHPEPATGTLRFLSMKLERRPAVRWDFNQKEEYEGWFPIRDGDMATPQSDGQCLVGQAVTPGERHYIQPYLQDGERGDGARPRMACHPNLDLDAETYHVIRMRMAIEKGEGPPVAHWHTVASRGLDHNFVHAPHSALRAVGAPEEGYQLYEADLGLHPYWNGRITQLMLAPVVGKDARFRIDWIEITTSPTAE